MNRKQERQKVFDKYNGHCALCGCVLDKGWHVWDIIPIQTAVASSGELVKINTEQDNLIPACKECGSVRIKNESGKMDLEQYRKEILEMYLFVRDDAIMKPSTQPPADADEIGEALKGRVEHFIKHNRKICWEAEMEDGEFCIGENKLLNFIESLHLPTLPAQGNDAKG